MAGTFRHKLDIYYIAAIGYVVTFVVYLFISGTLIGDRFEAVLRDPVLYLLGGCAVISLAVLLVMALMQRSIVVEEHRLTFRTRIKKRSFGPQDIAWIGLRHDARAQRRFGRVYPMLVMRLRRRRRLLRFRPDNFEGRNELVKAIEGWAAANQVELRSRWRRRLGKRGTGH